MDISDVLHASDILAAPPAVIGLGRSDYGQLWREPQPGREATQLAVAALQAALADAGLDAAQLDGLLLSRLPLSQADALCAAVGVERAQLRWLQAVPGEGRFCAPALLRAARAVSSHQARYLALVYANDSRSRRVSYGGQLTPQSQYGDVFGFTSIGAWLAMAWQRYRRLYQADDAALAQLACSARQAARLDPAAVPLPPLTREDYFAAPYVAQPLRRPDYCLVNDGAVCLLLAAPQLGTVANQPPVYLRDAACAPMPAGLYMGEDLFFSPARRLLQQLRSRPTADDLLLIYDNFTPNILLALEGFGLAEQGQAWRRVLERAYPRLNPGGGMLANSYMQGWNLLHEAVLQLRGQAGGRQVEQQQTAWYLCTAAVVSALQLGKEVG